MAEYIEFDKDHHAHHHKETFITKYIFSQDHKMIAKQYLITGLFMGIVGIAMSLLFRLQLAWPEQPFWIFEALLGKWAPDGVMDPNVYLALVTIHGTIMVFFVLTAGLSGTFSNLLIPLQIGARDMASGLLNMISFWLFFLSSLVMLMSLFVEAGPAAAGWTIYPPLSALPQAQPGSGLGMTLWLVSMTIFIASSLLGSLNYIVTVINLRTKGMTMSRLPLTIWAFFVTAIIGVVSFPVLLSAGFLLIMDRSFGTSFFLSDIFIQGEVLHYQGGSPVLYEHLFWFLGHPEVYIVLLPALGITSEVIATNTEIVAAIAGGNQGQAGRLVPQVMAKTGKGVSGKKVREKKLAACAVSVSASEGLGELQQTKGVTKEAKKRDLNDDTPSKYQDKRIVKDIYRTHRIPEVSKENLNQLIG